MVVSRLAPNDLIVGKRDALSLSLGELAGIAALDEGLLAYPIADAGDEGGAAPTAMSQLAAAEGADGVALTA